MNILFYDNETTGKPDWHSPSEGENQPHIIQLAAALVDDETHKPIASMNLIIKPDGWVIPEDVVEVHGITTEHASQVGVPEEVALGTFLALWRASDVRVAHNEQFDARIIRIATKRFCDEQTQDEWKAGAKFCTMRNSTNICQIPTTNGRGKYKLPKLEESYFFMTGREMSDAHTAQGDVRGCMAVYWGIRDRQQKDQQQHKEQSA